jgi:antirestriction protein ArdC
MRDVSDERRQKQREADRQKTREAVEALQSSDGWQHWLAARRHFHTYSFNNQLLIAHQKPHATMVAGFRAWLKLGYCVRHGEQALRIWVPMPPTKRVVDAWKAKGSPKDEKPKTRFRLGPVFDRSQVDPLPAPAEPVALDPPIAAIEGDELGWVFPRLAQLAEDLGINVVVEPMPEQQGGCYVPATQTLAINERKPVNHRVKTMVHEMAHALLRLEKDANDVPLRYSEEELVVESTAFTVCGSLGLDTSAFSIPYLASWSRSATLDTIELAAKLIDRIAKRIEEWVSLPEA